MLMFYITTSRLLTHEPKNTFTMLSIDHDQFTERIKSIFFLISLTYITLIGSTVYRRIYLPNSLEEAITIPRDVLKRGAITP